MYCNENQISCFMMSKIKSRVNSELCSDCNSADPAWAAINRGILLCSDCASVHRSLGRHVSQIKSIRQGYWTSSVLNFVNQLNTHGANSVWEHVLLDPSSPKNLKRRPNAKDSLHPTKADFIRAKHLNLAYVLKPTIQNNEDPASVEAELSKQLHASVRTSNLETSLRLLVQGADPNYVHEEKGSTTPIHQAAKFGQASQIELLIVYGADLLICDGNGQNAVEIARANKHNVIAERLVEAQFEVTDRIIYFLCGRKPDHLSGQHLIIPEQGKADISEQLKIARGKLQLIPNKMFEELVMDLYEEVDRRETEAIWATSALNPEIGAVPFLPTNPHLSATRNQGRQKLARFNQAEFHGFLIDVLIDARRRQNIATLRPLDQFGTHNHVPSAVQLRKDRESTLSDDEPLYDAVADDDYAQLTNAPQTTPTNPPNIFEAKSSEELAVLRKQLKDSESQINELRTMVEKLATENTRLKSQIIVDDVQLRIHDPPISDSVEVEPVLDVKHPVNSAISNLIKRPVSMYETRQMAREESRPPVTQSLYSMASNSSSSSSGNSASATGGSQSMPQFEEIKKRTDNITKRIQELWYAMQDMTKKTEEFVPCSERIRIAVVELIAIFPQNSSDEMLKSALTQLNFNTNLIQTECTSLQRAISTDDKINVELYLQQVRSCAYNLAKATKTLVTHFQQ